MIPHRQRYKFWQTISNDTLRSKIGLLDYKLSIYTIQLVLWSLEGKGLETDTVSQNRLNAI